MQAAARARSNIALIKYWGKAPGQLNVPAVGSISVTLDALWSETRVEFDAALAQDRFELDGQQRSDQAARVFACLDILREQAGTELRAAIVSRNNFPTAAGLASSASGFAALVAAAARALDLSLTPRELSIVARRGSGSAARSIFGGIVEMHAGKRPDGTDSFAESLLDAAAWPLKIIVAVTSKHQKAVGSGPGMARSAQSSVYYPAWVESHAADMDLARQAIIDRDFTKLAEVSEASCLKMHAAAMAAQPPLVYMNGTTLEGIHLIRTMRDAGTPVFFTVDAGPQIKAVCEAQGSAAVQSALESLPGVLDVIVSELGPGIEAV